MKKLKIVVPVLLLLGGGGFYKFGMSEPAPKAKHKVEGEVYVLPKDFMVNLEGGRFAKLAVALVFEHGFVSAPEAKGKKGAAPKPPDGYGPLPQEALVRHIVTDTLTGLPRTRLQRAASRNALERTILEQLEKTTDVKVEDVVFTDVTVQ